MREVESLSRKGTHTVATVQFPDRVCMPERLPVNQARSQIVQLVSDIELIVQLVTGIEFIFNKK